MRVITLRILLGLMPLLLSALAGCHKENIKPDPIPDFYALPQGNQSYDDSIVAFHAKYGTYILYKFSAKDFSYDLNQAVKATATVGNTAYVGDALDFLKSECLNFYPEKFLRKTLPFKILLASAIDSADALHSEQPYQRSVTGIYGSQTMMCMAWADSTILHLTPEGRKTLRSYLHKGYARQAIVSGAMSIPLSFLKYIPGYSGTGSSTLSFREGIVEDISRVPTSDRAPFWDFAGYVGMITGHSKADLDTTYLSPAVDVNGLIQLKYNAVIQFYMEQGVDLQAIGNLN
ncbi:hypothetical protein ACE38W_02545 [Chitinophaga sp. Hz27]|uniref:hypothetical protein n=1 Tax=Chitinophaga sp. Hz27 TaxID=3347169 RepID=UPI0035E0D723